MENRDAVLAVLAGLLGLAACQSGELTLVEPEGSGGGPSFGTLVATVENRPADSALARSLGWSEGIPGARVHVLRNGTAEWMTAETGGDGVVSLGELEPGLYYTYTERTLSEAEASRASTTVLGFGDGTLMRLGTDTAEYSYEVSPSRRTGLVISEVSGATPPPWEVPGAGFSTKANYFFEIYNQSTGTLFLDGRVFGAFPPELFCHGCANTCALGEPVRTDSTGVYTRWLLRFPGSGAEYPIQPGETKLIAAAAQDHRELHEDMLDLRDADFEIGVESFADNPGVPNLQDIGLSPFLANQLLAGMHFLAAPFDPSSLSRPWRDVRGNAYLRVPLSLLTDLALSQNIWPANDAERPPCQPIIHPNVDGFPGGFLEIGTETSTNRFSSFQREVLTVEDGIPILMDTNTSASDFSMMRYTPGELPR